MKLTPLALLAMAFCTASMAQSVAPPKSALAPAAAVKVASAPVTSTKTVAAVNVAMAPASAPLAAAPVGEVKLLTAADSNPFTGKALTSEQIQLKLEEAKLQTQTLEELLKQTNLTQELANVPLRKQVEAAQARTNIQKEELAQKSMAEQSRAGTEALAAAAKASKPAPAPKKTAKQKAAEAKAAEQSANAAPAEPARMARPTLLSVMDVGGTKSVVMDFAGATLVAADGEMTPEGPVRVIDAGTITLNGETYKVRANTLSRFVVSDARVESAAAKSGTAGFVPSYAPGGGISAAAGGLPPLPSMSGPATSGKPFGTNPNPSPVVPVPSFKMPPGVTSAPSR